MAKEKSLVEKLEEDGQVMLNIRFNKEYLPEIRQLEALSQARRGVSVSQIMRELVAEGLKMRIPEAEEAEIKKFGE